MLKYLIIILIFFTSCTTTRILEVPIEKVKIEYRDKLVHDSIYVRDSIDTHARNDTIFRDVYKYIYKEKIVNDTIIQRDSIPQIVEIETIKEVNKLKNWQIVLMIMGGGFIVLLLSKLRRFF